MSGGQGKESGGPAPAGWGGDSRPGLPSVLGARRCHLCHRNLLCGEATCPDSGLVVLREDQNGLFPELCWG